MRIIKLEIETVSKKYGRRLLRKAVSLYKQVLKKIKHFIDYVKKLYDLKGDYELLIDGFGLAADDTVNMLKQYQVYSLRIRRDSERINEKDESLSQVDQLDEEEEQILKESDSQVIEQRPKQRENPLRKRMIKSQQVQRKKNEKKVVIKKKNIHHESQEEDSSESESSQVQQKKIIKAKQTSKPKDSAKQQKQPSKIEVNSKAKNIPLVKNQKADKVEIKNNIKKKEVVQSDSSSSSSEFPILMKEDKKLINTKQTNVLNSSNQPKANQIHQENKPKREGLKKAIIRDSSSQSSPSNSKTPQTKPKKTQISEKPLNIKNQSKPPNMKIPPALRNKMIANKFQKHQQNQWIVVDKQKYHKWQQLGHKSLCQPPNKIRFKIVQLDEQRFIPVKSNWITGEVTSVSQSGVINLSNVEQEGKQFKKTYQIPQMNMDQLQLFRPLANKEQLQCLLNTLVSQQKQKQIQKNQPIKSQVTFVQQQPQSVENFVCGQVNYYFSDKNYLTDCYMQLHANSHPQKFMKLSFMLNFPKIKKVLRDQEKLFEYLRQDEKYETRNYEINFENKLIRKKNLVQKAKNQVSKECLNAKVQQEDAESLNKAQSKVD